MNFTKLIESMEIFKKYSPVEDEASSADCPFDIDYCTMMLDLDNILMDPVDVARLKELGWSVQKYPSWRSEKREVAEDEVGRYSIHFDTRDAFRARKAAQTLSR